jgi:hypothetical protein
MDNAIALARKFTGTVSSINVFTGPVPRKIRKIAAARNPIAIPVLAVHNAINDAGTARNIDTVSSNA